MRVVLRMTREVELGHHQAATVCQLMKGAGTRMGYDGVPPGCTPDAVEVGRRLVPKDGCFAFGLMLWGKHDDCCIRLARLLEAIGEIGRSGKAQRKGLGGNFQIDMCHSLVDLDSDSPLAIPPQWIDEQIAAAGELPVLTLRWVTPLSATLPSRLRTKNKKHRFFDNQIFPLPDLVMRMVRRLRDTCGVQDPSLAINRVDERDVRIVDPPGLARLHWIKWQYGQSADGPETEQGAKKKHAGKGRGRYHADRMRGQLYGVMGRIVIEVRRPDLLRALVLGQYAHVGEKTTFGLGRYAIEETQRCLPDHVPVHLRASRAVELAAVAMQSPVLQHEANRLNVPLAQVRRVAQTITEDTFQPQPVKRFLLPGDKPRLISVPSRPERVAQRAIYEHLYPVLDRFLSDSCIAYRRGLGRRTATERLKQSFQEGWRWALRSDFHQFFDSVDHAILRDKLEVFVQDDAMVDLLMKWVATGAPFPGRGLPTGAVISPMLANLFLQPFDAAVRQDGGRLVRYGDDFVLLFRDPSHGRAVLQGAADAAEQLRLHLNEDKTRLIGLKETPFDFLGYRFFAEKGWQFHGDGLTRIEDLSWHEAKAIRHFSTATRLPGEKGIEQSRAGTWIVGPGIEWIGIEGTDVVCRSRSQGTEDRFLRRRLSELIVLGPATLDHSLFRGRDETPLQVLVADDVGRWTCAVIDPLPLESADLVQAQVALGGDARRRLEVGRRLVAAKLRNHATLATAYPARGGSPQLAGKLRELAEQAERADQIPQLLGIEGAGAAAWYGEFEKRIHRRYKFETRVHPRASDPVNIMLNVAHTLLYRIISLALVREGFAPSVGLLHQSSPGHAALASDIQEAFRHLMDRVVIEATYTIDPGEFHVTGKGPFDLRMEAGAYRTLVAAVMKMLATSCTMRTQTAARSYRQQVVGMVRSLRRHLSNADAPFKVFEHIM